MNRKGLRIDPCEKVHIVYDRIRGIAVGGAEGCRTPKHLACWQTCSRYLAWQICSTPLLSCA